MRIRRRTAAEESEGLRRSDLMPGSRRDEDGITRDDGVGFAVDLHGALPFEDEVEFFAELVVVALGRLTDGDGGFGETLILHWRVGAV